PDFDGVSDSSWDTLLLGLGSGFTLAAPLLIALIASRLVDAEHRGGGWLMSATAGVAPGQLCRVKLLALGFLVAGATVLTSAAFTAVGFAVGIEAAWPAGRWIGLTLCVLAVNLVLLALHVVLAARVENQLVGMGVGLLGTVLALFSSAVPAPIAALTPWGHYSLAAASEDVDGQHVAPSPALRAPPRAQPGGGGGVRLDRYPPRGAWRRGGLAQPRDGRDGRARRAPARRGARHPRRAQLAGRAPRQ